MAHLDAYGDSRRRSIQDGLPHTISYRFRILISYETARDLRHRLCGNNRLTPLSLITATYAVKLQSWEIPRSLEWRVSFHRMQLIDSKRFLVSYLVRCQLSELLPFSIFDIRNAFVESINSYAIVTIMERRADLAQGLNGIVYRPTVEP